MGVDSGIRDIQNLIITCSACLALLILVLGTLYGIITGMISPEHIGQIEGIGVGGGLLGFGALIALVLKMSLGGGKSI